MNLYNNPIVQEDLNNISARVDWKAFNGKNVLITGANGHIATYIAYSFLYAATNAMTSEMHLYVLSRNEATLNKLYGLFNDNPCFHVIVGDVADFHKIETQFDYIFHFAGNASPYFIKNDPVGILKANINGTFNIAELSLKAENGKVIYASTREVYGANTTDDVLHETAFGVVDPLEARSCYPESKRAAESILAAYHNQHGLSYAIARIAHCYGPGMKLANDGRVMSDFINFAVNHQDIVLNSDGKALRSFCYITDAVVALIKMAADKATASVYNLANETDEMSIKDLAEYITSLAGDIKVQMNHVPTDSSMYCAYKRKPLDCSKLAELDWKPEVDIKTGVERTFKSFVG